MLDVLITETGVGGDAQLLGNDIAWIQTTQNMIYMAFFGGNPEQSTNNKPTEVQSLDWWGNNLLMPSDKSIQFNSLTENALNTTPLTSAGRVLIENAMKKDLEFFKDFGSIVSVSVSIVDTDHITAKIVTLQSENEEIVTIVGFKKKATGDWFMLDFNNDFYFG